MNKIVFLLVILASSSVIAELPISQTKFRKAPIEMVVKYAESDNPEAQLELAMRYYAGHQVERDVAQAFQWMNLSAEQRHPEAMYLLSLMYADGVGVMADLQKEELWFAKAIAALPTDERLRLRYKQGLTRSDDPQAFLQKCADAGYVPALLDLGLPVAKELYAVGKFEDAVSIFQQLADNGSVEGAYYLARIYDLGQGGLQADAVEAFVYYKKAAEEGYVQAQFELAAMYDEGRGTAKDPEQATLWYRQAAEKGHVEAQVLTAETEFVRAVAAQSIAQTGAGDAVSLNDYKRHLRNSVKWYRAAAEQNDSDALYVMGRLSASGEGVPKDFKAAVRYYKVAFAQGNAEAGFYLGLMLHAGLGVPKDLSAAIQNYKIAADKGIRGAQYYLGNCYRFGVGVPQHPMKGEGIYYGKILRDIQGKLSDRTAGTGSGYWGLVAAREYGLILWQRASSFDKYSAAAGWVGMAAQNGNIPAQKIFLQMLEQTNRSKLGGKGVVFEEHQANPAADAVRLRRTPVVFPYLQRDVEELFAETKARQPIMTVKTSSGVYKNVAGDDMKGLLMKYRRPSSSQAVGFSGIVLAGIELTNRETGERYWSLGEYLDRDPTYTIASVSDLFVSVDQASYPDAKISGWAVVYGHLLPDGRTIAVFDVRQSKTDSFSELFERNRYSTVIDNTIVSSIDYDYIVDKADVSDSDSLLDVIFGNGE